MSGIARLTDAGVSVWLDDLSRELIASGKLAGYIKQGIRGVTTNPSIFDAALRDGSDYQSTLDETAKAGGDVDAAIRTFTVADVQAACDLFAPVHRQTGGVDGRVSLEVDPRLARDTDATIAEAAALSTLVDRANLMVKIPATRQGLPAITATLAAGISVNVTLIFSLERYAEVIEAWLAGLEQAQRAGLELSGLESVASFFVSRVDTAIDDLLSDEHAALRGTAGVANAVLAYELFMTTIASPRWKSLEESGAHVQRPLWASTGVKNPAYPDTLYVDGLVGAHTVNTMPPKTIAAAEDHANLDTPITARIDQSKADLAAIADAGISLAQVTAQLEEEGVKKFVDSWESLRSAVAEKMAS